MIKYVSYDRVVNYLGDLDVEVLKDSLKSNLVEGTRYSMLIYHSVTLIPTEITPLIKISVIYQLDLKGLEKDKFDIYEKEILSQVDKVVKECLRKQSIIFS